MSPPHRLISMEALSTTQTLFISMELLDWTGGEMKLTFLISPIVAFSMGYKVNR